MTDQDCSQLVNCQEKPITITENMESKTAAELEQHIMSDLEQEKIGNVEFESTTSEEIEMENSQKLSYNCDDDSEKKTINCEGEGHDNDRDDTDDEITMELQDDGNNKTKEMDECESDSAFDLNSRPMPEAGNSSTVNGGNSTSLPFFFTQECDSSEEGDHDTKIEISSGSECTDELQHFVDVSVDTDDTTIKGNINGYRNSICLVNYSDSEAESDEASSVGSIDGDISDQDIDYSHSGTDTDDDLDEEDDDSGNDTESAVDVAADAATVDKNKKEMRKKKLEKRKVASYRTDGEVFPEELPPIEYLTISAEEDVKLKQMGTVTGIVDVLVVIASVEASPALYDDSVLFLENRQPLGLIFETFGTVETPYYSVRFNSNQDIVDRNINIGDKIMYAPNVSNLTKYVFIAKLRKMKCNDASWKYDNPPPPEERDYSDDEEERRETKRLQIAARNAAEKEKGVATGEEQTRKKKRRSKNAKDKADAEQDEPNRSGLLPGSLSRNPFKFKDKFSKNKSGLKSRKAFSQGRNESGGKCDRHQWKVPPPSAMFGGKPSWQEQPGLMGPRPNLPPAYNLRPPSFQPFSTFGGLAGGNRPPAPVANPMPAAGPQQNPFLSMFHSTFPPPPLANGTVPPPPILNASPCPSPLPNNSLPPPPFPNTSMPPPRPPSIFQFQPPRVGPPQPSHRPFSPFNFPPPSTS